MYQYYLSLGFYCGVAASMDQHNLRSASGPFDWCFSEFPEVLRLIETDFKDFLKIKNLQTIQKEPLIFEDIYNKLHFNHELYDTLEKDYYYIEEKYDRRIQKFQKMIKHPCCFVRAIRHTEEAQYIMDHYTSILKVIKKKNKNSDIIFLCDKEIASQIKYQKIQNCYLIDSYRSNTKRELREGFDTNLNLLSFLKKNSNPKVVELNTAFKQGQELRVVKEQYEILQKKYNLLLKVTQCNNYHLFSELFTKDIIIYGVGDIGKAFYEKIKNKSRINSFVDEYAKEKNYQEIPIKKAKELGDVHKPALVVVTAIEYQPIAISLVRINPNLEVISIDKLLSATEQIWK